MKINFAIPVVIFTLLLSCTQSQVQNNLLDIESYIMDRPDSALAVLEAMDRNLLVTEEDRAHHALLHAMALDKNFIDVSDDSLARVAVDYYSENGSRKYYARSLYYLGIAYYYQQDYKRAIIEFSKAENVATDVDSLYLGLIMVTKAFTYNKTYNAVEALKCLREAYEINKTCCNEYYVQTTELYLSSALYNSNHVEESLALLTKLINDSDTDSKVRLSAKASYAFIRTIEFGDSLEHVTKFYEEVAGNIDHVYLSSRDYWAWAYALNALGRKDEAQDFIDQLSSEESGTTSYWQYMIAKSNNDLKSALSFLEDYMKYNDVEVSDALKQSLALSQRDYFEAQAEVSEITAEKSRLYLLVVLMSSIFILMLVGASIVWYIRKQKMTKEQYLLYISEIRHQLDEAKKEDYPALKKKYLSLYKSRFDTIGELCEQYVHSQGLVNAEKSVYKKVVSLVDGFTNDYSNREKFETMLNEDLDNIMSRLRSEVPSLKEKDYVIFSFLVIGFDVTTISHLLNVTANTIYIRKSRIKSQIQELSPAHMDQFLNVMS